MKNIRKVKSRDSGSPRLSFIIYLSYDHGGTPRNHVKIEFRKNSKTHTCALLLPHKKLNLLSNRYF